MQMRDAVNALSRPDCLKLAKQLLMRPLSFAIDTEPGGKEQRHGRIALPFFLQFGQAGNRQRFLHIVPCPAGQVADMRYDGIPVRAFPAYGSPGRPRAKMPVCPAITANAATSSGNVMGRSMKASLVTCGCDRLRE